MIDARWVNHAQRLSIRFHYQRLQPQSNNGVVWIWLVKAHSGYILCQHVNYSQNEEPSGNVDTTLMMMWRALYPKSTLQRQTLTSSTVRQTKERIEQQYQVILARGNVEGLWKAASAFGTGLKGHSFDLTPLTHTSYMFWICVTENKHVAVYIYATDPLLRSSAA